MPNVVNWPHLMVEGYGCNPKKLDNLTVIYKFLEELPAKLKMTMLAKPYTMRNDTKTDYGITGFTIIAESHISIHTFPKKGYFTMDIYSCKPFDVEEVLRYTLDFFEAKDHDHHVVHRGREKIPLHQKADLV